MTTADTYRPHLDGLRTVAVYLVVLFHAGIAGAVGGFIGVDVFFVLSGYLVTQTLLRDVAEGGVRFARFYARRFKRLLPAAAATLIGTAFAYRAVAAPGLAVDALGSFQASFLYVANWYFIREAGGYFGAAVAENPLLHFWSLAVEEQFYAVWPLLLAGLFAIGRRTRRPEVRVVQVAVLAGAIASLALALAIQGHDPDRAYFGTDTRAYQLLGGALLALTPGAIVRVRRLGAMVPWLGVAATISLVVLATSWISFGPISRGIATAALTLAIIATLEAAPRGPLHRVLSSEPLVYLGTISYGTYLWHWPVIVVLVTVTSVSPLLLAAMTIAVASGLAALSARLLERPVRRSPVLDRHRILVVTGGLSISLGCALLVLPAILERPAPQRVTDTTAATSTEGLTPVTGALQLEAVAAERFGKTVHCVDGAPSDCTVVRGRGAHVLLMGDSNAQMLIPAFRSLAEQEDLTLSLAVSGGCPWQRGVYAVSEEVRDSCALVKEDAYQRVIPALAPDIVVLVNVAHASRSVSQDEAEVATRRSLDELRSPGRTLVLVESVLQSPADPGPLECLKGATHLEECRFVARTVPSRMDRFSRDLAAARPDVEVMSLDRAVCPFLPICDPVVGGLVVRWDHQHITAAYSATLGDDLAARFRAVGLLE